MRRLSTKNLSPPIWKKKLKDEQFTIVHVASHGEFGNEVDKTFLLTFDDKLSLDRLNQMVGVFRFRDDPLELLTLSACETAAGDDRAALGLAGIAIKAEPEAPSPPCGILTMKHRWTSSWIFTAGLRIRRSRGRSPSSAPR